MIRLTASATASQSPPLAGQSFQDELSALAQPPHVTEPPGALLFRAVLDGESRVGALGPRDIDLLVSFAKSLVKADPTPECLRAATVLREVLEVTRTPEQAIPACRVLVSAFVNGSRDLRAGLTKCVPDIQEIVAASRSSAVLRGDSPNS